MLMETVTGSIEIETWKKCLSTPDYPPLGKLPQV